MDGLRRPVRLPHRSQAVQRRALHHRPALPSHVVNGELVFNIVCDLLPGTVVTVQRGWVDYVVTEYSTASLSGKTVKERAWEPIGVAHPDFRDRLQEQASLHHGI